MATIKSYTDIEQSKVLAEILPIESADGFWEYHDKWYSEGDEWEGYEDYPRAEPYLEYTRTENEWKEDKSDMPCWSLAALLSILPKTIDHETLFIETSPALWHIGYRNVYTARTDNPVDTCYELILKLNELNLL